MKTKTRIFICSKCGNGHIVMTYKFHLKDDDKDDEIETTIKKCDKCGYQYYIKELFEASLVEINPGINEEITKVHLINSLKRTYDLIPNETDHEDLIEIKKILFTTITKIKKM